MKTKLQFLLIALVWLSVSIHGAAQGSAFTYQGQLHDNGSPANGTYDLTFSLYAKSAGGTPAAGPVTNTGVLVTNGLFTVTIDFGTSVWNGGTNWLQIGVETNNGTSGFDALAPRQELTPVPYAIYAEGANAAGLSGTLPAASFGGAYDNAVSLGSADNSFNGSGAGLVDVNALTLDGLGAANFWQLNGNSGTSAGTDFVGTTDNQALELHVNGQRALRLEPNAGAGPNVIGGAADNSVTTGTSQATIGGGEGNSISGSYNTIGGGYGNIGSGIFAEIGGGYQNQATGPETTVGGGASNLAGPQGATVAGGFENQATGSGSFVGGGGFDGYTFSGNLASGAVSTVAGGFGNQATYYAATVGGGSNNLAGNVSAVVGGGIGNRATGTGSFVGGGGFDGTYIEPNNASGETAVVGGGQYNAASGPGTFIGSGYNNSASGIYAVTVGGYQNQANGPEATVAGGASNTAGPQGATVAGGFGNEATGYGSFIGGGGFDGSSFEGNTAYGGASTVSGGFGNQAINTYATVAGGIQNTASGVGSVAMGGYANSAQGQYSFAGGQAAVAEKSGVFVWSDDSSTNVFDPWAQFGLQGIPNSFNVRSTGGFYIITGINNTNGIITSGVYVYSGSTSWSTLSDRNAKKDFAPVDDQAVLDKLSHVPIEQWHYKWEKDDDTMNIGPMAQDFKHAFYPGRDDKGITTLEFDGVELAAIKGLNQKFDARSQEFDARSRKLESENTELKQENDSLARRLDELEAVVNRLTQNK